MALVCLYLVSISADAVAAWVAATKWDKINPTVLYPFVVCAAQQQTVDNTIYNDGINVSPPILIFSVFKRVYSTCVRARAHHVYESSLSSHGLAIEIPWPTVGWSLRVFFFNPPKMKRRNSFLNDELGILIFILFRLLLLHGKLLYVAICVRREFFLSWLMDRWKWAERWMCSLYRNNLLMRWSHGNERICLFCYHLVQ
jgi:hypothetical protein